MSDRHIKGMENLPAGGALVIPNALPLEAFRDLAGALSGRQVLYLVAADAEYDPRLQKELDRPGIEAVACALAADEMEALRAEVARRVAAGSLCCFIPPPAPARPGSVLRTDGKWIDHLLRLGQEVVPVFLDRPREGLLSIENPGDYPDRVLHIGAPLAAGANRATFMGRLLDLWEAAFSSRPSLDAHLGWLLLQGLKKHGSKAAVTDGMDGSRTTYDKVLAAALALAMRFKEITDKPRLGIVLPPGRGALVANIAALFAGKTPVNLNYTAGPEAVESAMRQADLDRLVTVDAFVRRMQRFPWPPNRDIFFLEREMPALKSKITQWFLLSKMLPTSALATRLGLPREGGREEAVLLFTSGSSGEPKGVPLTHRNVIANTTQFAARLHLEARDSLLGCLPLFHSFGSTVTLWYPVIEGLNLVTFPSPLEVDKIAALVHEHAVSLLLATPTFLRGYLRKAKREQLAGLKLVVTGAEKLPLSLAETFEKRFGKKVLEGYGLTETSPVTNFNLPNLEDGGTSAPPVPSHRLGSVGQLLPGLTLRITDPVTDEVVTPDHSGIIWFRGPNVFEGYLHWGKKNREVVQEGWFRTGDIGRLDDDGFLFIEGRLSRFSKIGGEMVPHERVEEYIVRALGMEGEDRRHVAVMGVPDPAKGESLILLSTRVGEYRDQELTDLRYRLLEMKVPPLWIPRKIYPVTEIPVLASGKLDLRACQELAREVVG